MNCRSVEPFLSNYLEGRLPERVLDAVSAHVADCPACRRLRDDLQAVGDDLREFSPPLSSADLSYRAIAHWAAEAGALSGAADEDRSPQRYGSGVTHAWRRQRQADKRFR